MLEIVGHLVDTVGAWVGVPQSICYSGSLELYVAVGARWLDKASLLDFRIGVFSAEKCSNAAVIRSEAAVDKVWILCVFAAAASASIRPGGRRYQKENKTAGAICIRLK